MCALVCCNLLIFWVFTNSLCSSSASSLQRLLASLLFRAIVELTTAVRVFPHHSAHTLDILALRMLFGTTSAQKKASKHLRQSPGSSSRSGNSVEGFVVVVSNSSQSELVSKPGMGRREKRTEIVEGRSASRGALLFWSSSIPVYSVY